jgi:hypothetical protein
MRFRGLVVAVAVGTYACGSRAGVWLFDEIRGDVGSDASFRDGGADAPFRDGSDDDFDEKVADAETSRQADASTGCVPPPSGIMSWWTGDNTLADQEGRNPGTVEGAVTFGTGRVGNAFVFDGASAVLAQTNDFPIGAADRTVELWVYLSSSFGSDPSLTEMFVQYGTFGTTGAAFALFTYGTPALYWSQWGASFTGGSMSIGVWTHIAAKSSAGTVTLFENGEPVASSALSPYDTPSGTTFFIGGQGLDPQGKMDRLTGMADEVTVYDRALSQMEIASIYAAGSAGKCH